MQSHTTLELYRTKDNKFSLPSPTETSFINKSFTTEKLDRENPNLENVSSSLTFDPAIIIAPIFFLVMSIIVLAQKFSYQLSSPNLSHKRSCEKCRFFSNNKYLKCAVQPSLVLTEHSATCPDYHPQENKSLHSCQSYSHKR